MANWLNQLQSLLGQQGQSSSSDDRSHGKDFLLPGALGGLAGLLVASKSSRKLLAKYGTGALLVGGGAVAGSVLWNKYQQKLRTSGQQTSFSLLKAMGILTNASGQILKRSCARRTLTCRGVC